MTESVALRRTTYSHLIDDGDEKKNGKSTKKCAIKGKLKFKYNKRCLEETQLENKINQLEKYK